MIESFKYHLQSIESVLFGNLVLTLIGVLEPDVARELISSNPKDGGLAIEHPIMNAAHQYEA